MSYYVVTGDAPDNYHHAHTYNLFDAAEDGDSDCTFQTTGLLDVYGDVTVQFKRQGYDEWLGEVPVDGAREGWRFPSENIVAARVKGEGEYRIVFYPNG